MNSSVRNLSQVTQRLQGTWARASRQGPRNGLPPSPAPTGPQSPEARGAVLSPREGQAQTWDSGSFLVAAEGPAAGWPGLGEGQDAGGVGFL